MLLDRLFCDIGARVAKIVQDILQELDEDAEYMVCIEKQLLWAGPHSSSMCAFNCAIQCAFHAAFATRGIKSIEIDPKVMQEHYGLGKGREKKLGSVRTAKKVLQDGVLIVPDHLKDFFNQQRKKDDLADSLLYAIMNFD